MELAAPAVDGMDVAVASPALVMNKRAAHRGIIDTPLIHRDALESDLNYLLNFHGTDAPPSPRSGSRDLPGGRRNRGPVT
jgi:hypothetical protein